jgi:hypothetical protein
VDLEVDRTVTEAPWQLSPQRVAEVLAEASLVLLPEEEENARLPVVVGRHLVVESQHLGPATEKCRTVWKRLGKWASRMGRTSSW